MYHANFLKVSDSLLPLFLCLEQSSSLIFQIASLIQFLSPSSKFLLLARFLLLVEGGLGMTPAPGAVPSPDTA